MSLSITPIKNCIPISFNKKVEQKTSGDQNPISRNGETMLLLGSTFVGGLALGARLLFEIWDLGLDDTGSFLFEKAYNQGSKLVNKAHKNVTENTKAWLTVGATGAIIAAALSGFALLYTAFNTPKINYKSKINTFEKGKKMDVYIKANNAEKELYKAIDQQAQKADDGEKENLRENYMKMQMAHTQVPDFIKLKR